MYWLSYWEYYFDYAGYINNSGVHESYIENWFYCKIYDGLLFSVINFYSSFGYSCSYYSSIISLYLTSIYGVTVGNLHIYPILLK